MVVQFGVGVGRRAFKGRAERLVSASGFLKVRESPWPWSMERPVHCGSRAIFGRGSKILLVLLRLSLLETGQRLKLQELSVELEMSVSAVHTSIGRCKKSALIVPTRFGDTVSRRHLTEVILHGVRYFIPAERGAVTRGIPTAHAAPPLVDHIVSDELPPVWPHPQGTVRGEALEPLYSSAPAAALKNPALYELLALVDAVRGGAAREHKLAADLLKKRLAG
jgi:hypothetical protein